MNTKNATLLGTAVAGMMLLLSGCGTGLQLTRVRSAYKAPSNVAVYFKVQDGDGNPIGGLTADKFVIYEDDKIVSQYESKQTILNPEAAASHYTLLLVDMSGSISESGERSEVVKAVTTFTEQVEKYQKVGVYAFDGSEDIHAIAPFTTSAGTATAAVQQFETFQPKDPSTNLNGAIVVALKELETALSKAPQAMHFGTLVVFSDGTDQAKRVSEEDLKKAISETPYDVFAIGLGAEMSEEQLSTIGKNGTAMAKDRDAVANAFSSIAKRIENHTKSYYLLSYCSPSRAGEHQVRIEAIVKDGDSEKTGSLESTFDATGFRAGCDPRQMPDFDIRGGDAVALPPEDETASNQTNASTKSASVSIKSSQKPAQKAQPKQSSKPSKSSASVKGNGSGGSDFNP